MMEKLGVFSGDCLQGIVGHPTKLKDLSGADLFVGDIVYIQKDYYSPNNFTVVCDDRFVSYSNGKIIQQSNSKHFVMGIKSSDIIEWNCLKVKDHRDCINGEKWKSFGFNYKIFDSSIITEVES